MHSPVRSPVYNDGGNKRDADDDGEKREKLQKNKPEIPPVTVSMPTSSIRPESATQSPSLFPVASTIAADPDATPINPGPNPIPPSNGVGLNPNPNGMPILGTSAPALANVSSPVVAPPVSPTAGTTLVPSVASSTNGSTSDSNSTSPASTSDAGTGAPTLAPALQIFGTGLRVIQTDPIYLRITGDFDPEQEEDVFFRTLELLLGPYSRANIGDRLQEIRLTVDFITDPASVVAGAATKLQVEQTSWCEVLVVYLISGDSYFSSALGTEFLERFFQGGNKQNFIARLKNDSVDISSLETFDEFPTSFNDEITGNDGVDDGDGSIGSVPDGNENEDTTVQTSKKNYTSAIVAAVLSAGIVLCALGAIVMANRRRRRERVELGVLDAQVNPVNDMGYSDIEEDDVLMKRKYYRQAAVMSSGASTLSTLPTGVRSRPDAQRQNEATLTPEEVFNLEAAANLTDHDGDRSFCAMHNEYNEVADSNQEAPQSPVWSVDNYSTASPYSTEEDYVVARRRWHQLNDPDYITDYHSVGGHERTEFETNSEFDGDRSIKAASIA